MIRPAKHLDLNTCVLRVASILLAKLRTVRICTYTELNSALTDLVEDADVVFIYAVHFLFLLERVDYHAQTDSFEYIQPNNIQ